MNRRAELSINLIIMVVIAIIILVIIVFLIARSGKDANNSTACPSKGGICKEYDKCAATDQIAGAKCDPSSLNIERVCCNPLG
jgi:hypothetical protein